jgi:hypothetical protein
MVMITQVVSHGSQLGYLCLSTRATTLSVITATVIVCLLTQIKSTPLQKLEYSRLNLLKFSQHNLLPTNSHITRFRLL